MQFVKQRVWFDNSHKTTDTVTFEHVNPDSQFEGKRVSERSRFLLWEITKKPQGQSSFKNWWKLHFQQNTAAGIICRLHVNSKECQAELTSDHSAQREPEGRCRPASWHWGARARQEATGEGLLNTQPNPVQLLHTADKMGVCKESRDKPHMQKAVPFCGRRKGEFLHRTNHVRDSTAPLTWQETLENTGSWNTRSFYD